MKIILNPKYEFLRDYLLHLEEHFEKEGKEIFRDRNVLRTLQVDGLTLCVKRYAPTTLRDRLSFRSYKMSKAKRAYFKPLELRERGFESPEPVAFVCSPHGWLRSTNYFVCLHSDYRYSLASVATLPEAERGELVRSFAHFAARLHEDGFLHRDFSSSNILFDKVNGRFHFALIDTNSMRTGRPVSVERGCANLGQLTGDDAFFSALAREYAAARGADCRRCEEWIAQSRRVFAPACPQPA